QSFLPCAPSGLGQFVRGPRRVGPATGSKHLTTTGEIAVCLRISKTNKAINSAGPAPRIIVQIRYFRYLVSRHSPVPFGFHPQSIPPKHPETLGLVSVSYPKHNILLRIPPSSAKMVGHGAGKSFSGGRIMSFLAELPRERRYELAGVAMLGLTAFLFIALATDGYQGSVNRPIPGMGPGAEAANNALGKPGFWVAGVLTILLGRAAHAVYFLTAVWGLML